MNIVIILATIIVILGLVAAYNLPEPTRRRIRNLFLIALVLTIGGCFGLVQNLDSITNDQSQDMWSNSLIWVVLFASGLVVFAVASIVSIYLNSKHAK